MNVKVVLRCRPFSVDERRHAILNSGSIEHETIVECKDSIREVSVTGRRSEGSKTYNFDGVCGPHTTQQQLFDRHILPLVEEVLEGFNCTIFAYGQTGTGKTYTMEGSWAKDLTSEPPTPSSGEKPTSSSADNRLCFSLPQGVGVIPRAVALIFQRMKLMDLESSLKVSFMEIYNEELNDLLQDSERLPLRIYDNSNNSGLVIGGGPTKGLAVKNLQEVPVETLPEVYSILSNATKKRKTAETSLNRKSSRSHSIFTITITMKEVALEGEDIIRIGKLNLVDLAGSENIQRSGTNTNKDRTKEAGMINQSLVALGRVINALTAGASTFIPYRDSKLTRLLQESLGGRTKTCIIATISPAIGAAEETISTLDYAYRAKHIKNRPEINQKVTQKYVLKEMSGELERLKKELALAREKSGEVHLTTASYNELEAQAAELQSLKKSHSDLKTALGIQEEQVVELKEKLENAERDCNGLATLCGNLRNTLNAKLIHFENLCKWLKSELVIGRFRTERELSNFRGLLYYRDGLQLTLQYLGELASNVIKDVTVFGSAIDQENQCRRELEKTARQAADEVHELRKGFENVKNFETGLHNEFFKTRCVKEVAEIARTLGDRLWTSGRAQQIAGLRREFESFINSTEIGIDAFTKREEEGWKKLFELYVIDKERQNLSLARLSETIETLISVRLARQERISSELKALKTERAQTKTIMAELKQFFSSKFEELRREQNDAISAIQTADQTQQTQLKHIASGLAVSANAAAARFAQELGTLHDEYAESVNSILNKGSDQLVRCVGTLQSSLDQQSLDMPVENYLGAKETLVDELHSLQTARHSKLMKQSDETTERIKAAEDMARSIINTLPKALLDRQSSFVHDFTLVREQLRDEAVGVLKKTFAAEGVFVKGLLADMSILSEEHLDVIQRITAEADRQRAAGDAQFTHFSTRLDRLLPDYILPVASASEPLLSLLVRLQTEQWPQRRSDELRAKVLKYQKLRTSGGLTCELECERPVDTAKLFEYLKLSTADSASAELESVSFPQGLLAIATRTQAELPEMEFQMAESTEDGGISEIVEKCRCADVVYKNLETLISSRINQEDVDGGVLSGNARSLDELLDTISGSMVDTDAASELASFDGSSSVQVYEKGNNQSPRLVESSAGT